MKIFPAEWEVIKVMFQTTLQILFYNYIPIITVVALRPCVKATGPSPGHRRALVEGSGVFMPKRPNSQSQSVSS